MASQGHSLETTGHDSKLHVPQMTPEQQIALVQEARAARLREHGCPIARSGAEGPKVTRAVRQPTPALNITSFGERQPKMRFVAARSASASSCRTIRDAGCV